MYGYDDMCLPKNGTLHFTAKSWPTENRPRGFNPRIPYAIVGGMHYSTFNFKYDENGYGHALHFDSREKEAAEIAKQLVLAAIVANKESIVEGIYKSGYKDNFSNIRGHYLLLDLQLDPHRPNQTRKVILFIGTAGQTYQHYHSNVMKTDEEVLHAFQALIDEHERPERERKAAEAHAAAKREEMFASGAM